MAHAKLSASAAHRWTECPGSIRLSQGLADTPSEHAAAGTVAHSVAAEDLLGGANKAEDWLDKDCAIDGFKITCDQEMVDGVNFYVDTVKEDAEKGDQSFVEVDLTPVLSKLHPDLGGTADAIRWRPKTKQLRVFDFKYGAGKLVMPTGNKQLLIYALGALLTVGKPAKEVVLTIVQPRIEHDEGRVRDWTFPAKDLLDFAADLEDAANAAGKSDAPLVPGEAQCQFCPARRICPALEEKQHALVAAEFNEVTTYDPKKLSLALDAIPMVEARIKALREFAYTEAEKGNPPPGYKLVAKRGTRKWSSEERAIEWAKKLAVDPFEAPTLKSPAQLEKELKGQEKKDMAEFVVTVSSGHTLVHESDKRPAVHAALAGEFSVISTNEDK